jgi:hypothetical protein
VHVHTDPVTGAYRSVAVRDADASLDARGITFTLRQLRQT